jgi:mannosyltransferase
MRGPQADAVSTVEQRNVGEQDAGTTQGDRLRSGRLPRWLAIVVPALAELIVGGYRIAGPSLWRDEAATISGSQRPFAAIMSLTFHQDAVHGAYYLLMHVVIAVGGTSETALRFPSLIAMCLAVGLTAALGRRLAEGSGLPAPTLTGLLGGLLLVAVPLTTRYAQEARPYALTTLFAVLATYVLVRAAASRRWQWWIGYVAALTLTGLFDLFAVLLAVAHGLSLFAARARVTEESPAPKAVPVEGTSRRWLVSCVIAAVLLAPLAVLSVRQSAQLNWVTRPDPSTVATLIRDFAGATLLIPVIALLAILGCVAGPGVSRGGFRGVTSPAGGGFRGVAPPGQHRGAFGALTLATVALPWLIVPPVVLLAISLVHPVYVERYIVFCLPGLSLLVATGLVWLTRLAGQAADQRGLTGRTARVLAALPSALLAAVVVVALIGPQRAIRLPTARADNLRAVAAVLSAHERRGDAILYLPWDTALVGMAYPAPFERLRNVGLGESPVASATLRGLPAAPSVVAARLRTVSRVWAVQWTQALPSAGPVRTGLLTASGLRLVRRWRVASVLLSLYARP